MSSRSQLKGRDRSRQQLFGRSYKSVFQLKMYVDASCLGSVHEREEVFGQEQTSHPHHRDHSLQGPDHLVPVVARLLKPLH